MPNSNQQEHLRFDVAPTGVTVTCLRSGLDLRVTPRDIGFEADYFDIEEVGVATSRGAEIVRAAASVLKEWSGELRSRIDAVESDFRDRWRQLPNRAEEWEELQRPPTSYAHAMVLHQKRRDIQRALFDERKKLERWRLQSLKSAVRPGLSGLPEWALEQVAAQCPRLIG